MNDHIDMVANTISIDPKVAKDLDDALAVVRTNDGWKVDVLIPDVPALVRLGDENDQRARQMGITTYDAAGIKHSMLPYPLVSKLSLSPNNDQPVIHVSMSVNSDLSSNVESIKNGLGRTLAAMTYDDAEEALKDPKHQHHIAITAMWDLASRLAENRATAIGAEYDESGRTWLDEEGRIVAADDQKSHRANILVMELMILVNSTLAKHARDNDIPVLYRNHVLEGYERGDRAGAAQELAMREKIGAHTARKKLRSLSNLVRQAEISTKPMGHWGLDAEAYAWFTSPLRRYCDLVSLRALVHGIHDENLSEIATRMTGLIRSGQSASADRHGRVSRYEMLRHLSSNQTKLEGVALHIVIRAMTENPGFDKETGMRYIAKRMSRDDLSGRDIASLIDHVSQLFGDEAMKVVNDWVAKSEARGILLTEYRGEITQKTAAPDDGIDYKGQIHHLARIAKAEIVFGAVGRSGPPHAPVFTVDVKWHKDGISYNCVGIERTIKAAEQAASKALIEIIGDVTPEAKSDKTPIIGSPKSRLFEIAAATGAVIIFKKAEMEGPPHAPSFTVEVQHRIAGIEQSETGSGSSKREAERIASEKMIQKLSKKPD